MSFAIPDYPVAFWMAAVTAVLLLGISKAGFAGGVGALTTPLVALTIGVADAVAILLPLLIIVDILALFYYRRDFDRRSVRLLLPGSLIGILAGGLFFSFLLGKDHVFRAGLGIIALIFVAFQVTKGLLMGKVAKRHPGAFEGLVMGALSGFISTIAHAGGPPVAIFLLPQQFPKHIYVGTTAIFFAITNMLKLIPYGTLGLLKPGNFTTIALLAPLCYVGVRLGVYLNRRVSEEWFTRVVYTFLFLAGIHLVWTGIFRR